MRIRATACALAVALSAGCGSGGHSIEQRTIGFEVQRVVALAGGDVLVGGIRIASRSGARCGDGRHEVEDFLLVRLRRDGLRAGTLELPGDRVDGCARSIADLIEQPDGSLLLSGWVFHPSEGCCEDNSSQAPIIARFGAHGLDRDFGDDGVVGTGEPSGRIARLADGSIMTAAGSRYRSDGNSRTDIRAPVADAVFAGGVATLPGGGFAIASLVRAQMSAFVLQVFGPDRREEARSTTTFADKRRPYGTAELLDVLAAGDSLYVLGQYSPAPRGAVYAHFLYRFDLHGRRDRPFGRGGLLPLDPPGRAVAVDQVALQADGRVLAVGAVRDGPWRLFVSRYTAAGEPDASFGRSGTTFLPLGPTRSDVLGNTRTSLAVRPDGTIVAAATTLARKTFVYLLRPDGAIDPSFGRIVLR
jgi:uncharacterized delta-60 repeat protein